MKVWKRTAALVVAAGLAFSTAACDFSGGAGLGGLQSGISFGEPSSSRVSHSEGASSSHSVGVLDSSSVFYGAGGNTSSSGEESIFQNSSEEYSSNKESISENGSAHGSSLESSSEEEQKVFLNVAIAETGYGYKWLEEMVKGYEEANSDVAIIPTVIHNSQQFLQGLQYEQSEYDLAFGVFDFKQLYSTGVLPLADISDVYADIGAKLNPIVYEWYNFDGRYYALPYAQATMGIVYHADKFEQYQLQVPRTTNELLSLTEEIYYKTGIAPIGGCSQVNYWEYLFNAWFAQYDFEAYQRYWQGKDENNNPATADIANQMGVFRTLELYEKLMTRDNLERNFVANDFTQAQVKFLMGETFMMAEGEWLVNEASDIIEQIHRVNGYDANESIAMMKMPVLSAMVENLSFYQNDGRDYDAVLAAIIDYVDGVTDVKPVIVEGCSITDEDIARVAKARSITPSLFGRMNAAIPQASKKSDIAKDFLRYLYSEEGIEIYRQSLNGLQLPLKDEFLTSLDGTETQWVKSLNACRENAEITGVKTLPAQSLLFWKGGLTPTYGINNVTMKFFNGATAADVFSEVIDRVAANWERISGIE